MTRLAPLLFVAALVGSPAHASGRGTAAPHQTFVAKVRRAAGVALVGGMFAASAAHATDLNKALDEAMRPTAIATLVVPADVIAKVGAAVPQVAGTGSYESNPVAFKIQWATGSGLPHSLADAELSGVHSAVGKWAYSSNGSTLAKWALIATDPSHFSVDLKLQRRLQLDEQQLRSRPGQELHVSIQYHSSFH